jgi:tRNA dimethylallyltransferase
MVNTDNARPKVVVIVGPTASGKTSLSIKLAQAFNGEIISADSRQVYRGLDLGSGKVTPAEMDGVPHHLIDVVDPHIIYTAADFIQDGRAAVASISERGQLPLIVGGTFQYVDALLGKQSIPSVPPNVLLRTALEAKSLDELQEILSSLDPIRAATIDANNPRRLIRAIEIATALGYVPPPVTEELYDSLVIGIRISTEDLHHNIHTRLHTRLHLGMVAEVEGLIAAGVTAERLESLGLEYRYIGRFLHGVIDYDTMVKEIEIKTRQFAKRQITWLKRDKSIIWVNPNDVISIQQKIQNFLLNY